MFDLDFSHAEFGPNWIQTKLAFYLSVGFALLSVLISCIHIVQHLLHYSMPGIQIYVIRILVICPVYAISSSLALGLGKYGAYAEISRDVYEAFVIYSFFNLILEYSGGETDCIYQIENEPQLKWPCPLCFLKPRPRDARLMRFCLRGVLQFVIIKPIVAVMDIIMIATGNKTKLGYEIFVFIVYNISYAWALYCMFVFYQAIKKLIKKFRPILKFASIKAIVFATYYQSLAVQASSMSPENTVRWNDFILCIEMVFFSGLLMIAFPTSEFQGGIPDSKFIENVRSVLSVHDVMQDVYHNFIPVYHDYTLQRSETETPEVVRMKTYLAGNLDSVAIEMSRRYRGRNKRLAFNSLLRGSTPISARLRGINRPFSRLRTPSENSSDVSDSEQYYDEESLESYGSSHDSLDDSTDSTMDLCTPSQDQKTQQQQQRLLPQFTGLATGKPRYSTLNSSSHKDEDTNGETKESKKSVKRPVVQQSQVKSQPGHRFLHHKDPKNDVLKSEDGRVDYETPLNLTTISILSPVEQDILERRINAMATHGIGLVVTKNGIEIRAADYHPTGSFFTPTSGIHITSLIEEEGVVNEGFMSVDDSSHHSKYDRQSLVISPLSHSTHNPAAANLPRLPKKSTKKKHSPEKIPPPTEKLPRPPPPPPAPAPAPSSQSLTKPLPTLPPLPPPPSLQNQSDIETKPSASSEVDIEVEGWGEFIDYTEGFANFSSNSPTIDQSKHDESLSPVDDPFLDSSSSSSSTMIHQCLEDLISVIEMLHQEESSSESSHHSSSSPSYVMIDEQSCKRESSESDTSVSGNNDHRGIQDEAQVEPHELLNSSESVPHPDEDISSTSHHELVKEDNEKEEDETSNTTSVDPTNQMEYFTLTKCDENNEGDGDDVLEVSEILPSTTPEKGSEHNDPDSDSLIVSQVADHPDPDDIL